MREGASAQVPRGVGESARPTFVPKNMDLYSLRQSAGPFRTQPGEPPSTAAHRPVCGPPGHSYARRRLRIGLQHQAEGLDTVVCGNAIPGETLACPSALQLRGFGFCLLDCYDVVRIDRLRKRGPGCDTMEMLCWAAWQRMHAVDPQWRPDVIREGAAGEMQWDRWQECQRGDARWPKVWRLDTTDLTIDQVVMQLSAWIDRTRAEWSGEESAT